MEVVNRQIEEYCENHTTYENDLLAQLNRETHLKVMNPRMLSGHLQGRWLSMVSKMIEPKRILEIGTYTGYSALCLAEGLSEDGMLFTMDVNEELEDFTQSFFDRSAYKDKIRFMIGDAGSLINSLNETFDLVFIDADKKSYDKYYKLVLPKVRKGGYILADNVLWSGKVIDETEKEDKKTRIINEFNTLIQQDEEVENVLMPIRDGLMLIRKK